jgi:hypothetical protein
MLSSWLLLGVRMETARQLPAAKWPRTPHLDLAKVILPEKLTLHSSISQSVS